MRQLSGMEPGTVISVGPRNLGSPYLGSTVSHCTKSEDKVSSERMLAALVLAQVPSDESRKPELLPKLSLPDIQIQIPANYRTW